MSTSIEQRIVEMKFDNAAFSKGVDSTIQDLDKLDKATKFEGGKNGLKQLQVAADQVNFKQVLSGINSIQDSLNHMQSFGFQVFQNLSNQAINWATTMVKSLSVDQIAGGFNEYELKMDSIKTIMNSSGASLDVVKEKLNELNTYSDKTIYSFSDMTSSIGKFTNAGVDLDSAVNAIQGISNQAALAGANANDASRAMYNFAQALSSGSVKLIDWKSIENANMATVDFKQSLIDTAVAMGTVKETEEGYISTTTNAQGKTSELFTSTLGFNDALSSQWMTTEVLTQTLQNYATDTREMTEAERDAWVEKMKSLHYTDEQIARFEELGQKAFDSAQEVTTYSKMIDALREAVGSGWAQTFEILFGDLEEATKLWTGMNDVIGGIIASVADTRNGILELWKSWGGHTYLLQGLKEIYSAFKNVATYVGLAIETIFGHRFWGNFKVVQDFFKDRKNFSGNLVVIQRMASLLTNVSKKFFDVARIIASYFNPNIEASRNRLGQIYEVAQTIIVPARALFTIITGIAKKALPLVAKTAALVGSVILKLVSLIGSFFTVGGFQGEIYSFANMVVTVVGGALDFISGLIDAVWFVLDKTFLSINFDPIIKALGGATGLFNLLFTTISTAGADAYNSVCQLIDSFAQLFGYATIEDMFADIGTTISNTFSGALDDASGAIEGLTGAFEALNSFIEPIVTNLGEGFNNWLEDINDIWQNSPLAKQFTKHVEKLGESLEALFSKDTKFAKKAPAERLTELMAKGYTADEAATKIRNMAGEFNSLGGFIDYVVGKIDDFKTALSGIDLFSNIQAVLGDIKNAIKQTGIGRIIFGTFEPIIKTIKDTFKDFELSSTFIEMGRNFKEFFNNLKTAMANAPDIPTFFNSIKTSAQVLFETIKTVVGPKFQEFLDLLGKLKQALSPKEALPDGQEEEVSQSVVGMIQGFLSGLVKGIITFDWGKVMSLLTVILGFKFMKAVYDFLNGLSLVSKGFTGFGKTIKKLAKNVTDLVGAAKWQVMADSIFRIASALVMLAGAIFVLSLIPKENLQNAVVAMGAVTVFAIALMLVFGFVKKMLTETKDAEEKTNKLKEAITGFIDNAKEAFSKFTKLLGIAAIIAAIGVALVLMAKVIAQFSSMPWGSFLKGLAMMGLVIVALGATFAALLFISDKFGKESDAKKMASLALLIYSISASLQRLAGAVEVLGSLELPTLAKGIGAIVILMAAITGMIAFVGGISADVKGIAAAMLLLAVALTILVIPVTAFALLPFAKILQAALAIGVLIGAVGALAFISVALKEANVGLKEFGVVVLSLIGVAAALLIFAFAIKMLTDQGEQIKKYAGMLVLLGLGLAAFAAILGGIGYFLGPGLMLVGQGMLFFGVGLLAAAAAVWVFAQACVVFANGMDAIVASVNGREEEVVNAISTLIFAAIKGVLDGLAYALAAIIAGLDDAIVLLRQYLPKALIDLGLLLLECLGAIVWAVIAAIGEMFVWIYQKIDESFPMFWARVQAGWSRGWREFLALILVMLAGVFEGFPVIGTKVAGFLEGMAGDLIDKGKEKSDEILDAAKEELEKKTQSEVVPAAETAAQATVDAYGRPFEGANSANKITGFMDETEQKIKEGTPEVAAASEAASQEVVDNFNPEEGMQQKSGDVLGFLNNFAGQQQMAVDGQQIDFTQLYSQWPEGVSLGGDSANAELQQYMDQMGVTMSSQDFSDDASSSMQTYAQGVEESKTEANTAAEEVSTAAAESLKKGDARGSGRTQTQEFATGLRMQKSEATRAANDVGVAARDEADGVATSQAVKDIGLHFNQGLASGMSNNESITNTAARVVMEHAMQSAKDAAVIKSPSKKMEEVGYFWDAGLAIGIFKNGKMIFDTVTDTMKTAISKVKQSMAEMGAAIEESDIDFNPVITPVVDSDEAIHKLRKLNDILSGGTSVTMRSASRNASYDRQIGGLGTNNVTNNSNVSYVQNITSPRALRSRDIYRQTKNLIAIQKGARA